MDGMIVLFLKVVALDILFLILAHFGIWLLLPLPSTAYGAFFICDFFFFILIGSILLQDFFFTTNATWEVLSVVYACLFFSLDFLLYI